MTTVPRLQYSANAEIYFTMTGGVRESPTIPLIPEMLTIKDMGDLSKKLRVVQNIKEDSPKQETGRTLAVLELLLSFYR
jgi:hypothetical protein